MQILLRLFIFVRDIIIKLYITQLCTLWFCGSGGGGVECVGEAEQLSICRLCNLGCGGVGMFSSKKEMFSPPPPT